MMMEYCGNELKFIIFVNITLQYEGQFTEFLLFCGFFTHQNANISGDINKNMQIQQYGYF